MNQANFLITLTRLEAVEEKLDPHSSLGIKGKLWSFQEEVSKGEVVSRYCPGL